MNPPQKPLPLDAHSPSFPLAFSAPNRSFTTPRSASSPANDGPHSSFAIGHSSFRAGLLGLQLAATLYGLAACSPSPSRPLTPPPVPPAPTLPSGPTPIPPLSGTVQLLLQPPAQTVTEGDIFPLAVLLETGGRPLKGVAVYLDFDPEALQVEIVSGDTGRAGDLQLTTDVDNTQGHIDLALSSSSGSIAAGTHPLATIVFLAVTAPPSTSVRYAPGGARNTRAFTDLGDLPSFLRDATVDLVPRE